jgi:hypothetical protein
MDTSSRMDIANSARQTPKNIATLTIAGPTAGTLATTTPVSPVSDPINNTFQPPPGKTPWAAIPVTSQSRHFFSQTPRRGFPRRLSQALNEMMSTHFVKAIPQYA